MSDNWAGIEEVVAIADTGSFIGAARRLGLSPSHVSRAVNRIEQRIGTQLFMRTTRSVTMTEAGRFIVDSFRQLIDDRNDALQATQSLQEMSGEVRITCSVALGERFIEPLLRQFLEANPMIRIRLELTNRLLDLAGESFDIAIRTRHPSDSRFSARQIARRALAVLASPDYIGKYGVPNHPDDLLTHECLIGTNASWHFADDKNKISIRPNGRWRCNNGNAIIDAALAGFGICQIPEYYAVQHIAAGNLVPLLEEYKDQPEDIWAVYPNERIRIPKVRHVIDLLSAKLHALIQ